MAGQQTAEFPGVKHDNENLVRSLKRQGLETIKFDDVRYTHELIGEGFWGEVFKIQSGEDVMVLKTSKKDVRCGAKQGETLSLNEVAIMRTLNHPNIVKFLGVCVTDRNQLYPLLEYINGGTLEDFLLNENIEIPWITRFTIASNIASGMKYLHNHNIMHRDLTSGNILLRITESVDDVQVEALISDFGLAKDMKYKERALSQVGSVDWMAPEVILGKQYNKKADVFSYGIILCEMIGRCEADPETSVIRTMSFEVDFDDFTQRSCEGCPPQFLELAKSCCQLEPDNRPTFDNVYDTCSALIDTYSNWDLNANRKSMEKLNISVDLNVTLTVEEAKPEIKKSANDWNCKEWDEQPRFSIVMDDIKMLDEDSVSLRSFKSNTLSLRISDDTDRRASIINPIPSVDRNSGRIVLTIRNDASPLEMRSPETTNPQLLQELAMLNERDEMRALDELSVHSTLVLFDPGNNKMDKRRSSMEKQNKNAAPQREVPFGRRQFSKKKKIRPVWKNVFNKSKSPKHDMPQKTTGLINFFKSLGSSKHSNDSQQSGKSKISKGYTSEDKESGHVTRFAPTPPSPKHKKQSSKHDVKPVVLPSTEVALPTYHEALSRYASETLSPRFDLTPTGNITDPFFEQTAVCKCGECRSCVAKQDRSCVAKQDRVTKVKVTRNESYRSMKPLRTQSEPAHYDGNTAVTNTPRTPTDPDSNSTNRARSFRDKFGFLPDFLPDKAKSSKS